MAFADPQSVTINAVANSLPRISSGVNTGAFQKDDATLKLSVSHNYASRTRRQVRLDQNKIAPDVFTSENMRQSMSVYLVVDQPQNGYTNAELKLIVDGFLAYLSASSGANITKLLGGEN